nr:two-component regulator propeller domain-containing protein [uncultured Draconibacterium sp.]
MKYIVALAISLLTYNFVIADSKEYIFEQISPDAGFAFDQVSSIVEDKNGFIWFGCNNGLYYYNSLEIVKYNYNPTKENTPPSNIITNLYKDWNNTIWICTDNGICYFNEKENAFVRMNLNQVDLVQSKHNVGHILQYSDSGYLIIINHELYRFNIKEQNLQLIDLKTDILRSAMCLAKDNAGNILIGTKFGKLLVTDSTFDNIRIIYESPTLNSSNDILNICTTKSEYWLGSRNNGIAVVDKDGKLLKKYNKNLKGEFALPNNRLHKIIEQANGDIWVTTFDGIHVISKTGNQTIRPSQHNNLPHNIIFDFYIDRNGGTWIGTWTGGLAYYNPNNYRFEHIKRLNEGTPTPRNVISSFAEKPDGNILIGSENLGLFEYDLKNRLFVESELNQEKVPFKRIESLLFDNNKNLWIGTFNEGLWKYANQRLTEIESNVSLNLTNTSITAADNGLWLGGIGNGLLFFDFKTNKTTEYHEDDSKIGSLSSNRVRETFLDSRGDLWICTNYGLSLKRKKSENFERFFYNESNNSISRNMVYTVAEDNAGNIWIGTAGGGIDIYDPKSNSFYKLNQNKSIGNADVFSIIKDLNDDMWIASNKGIFQYNTNTNKFKSYSMQDGILGNQYNPNASFINSTGKIFFGGANGFNIIDPDIVKENPVIPDIFLSKLLVNNHSINSENTIKVNSKHFANIDKLELKHHQNTLVFGFVANNFIKSSKNQFKYRIKNYIDDWVEISQGQDVSLAKVPPGKYVLEILGSNNDGVWSQQAKEIEIIIHPPFWLSWYAYILYAIFIGIISFIILKELAYRVKLRKEILAERYKHEAEENLFLEKTKFFTNISHEFRTPLTLIISPLNSLISRFENEKGVQEHLKIMKRNADRLLRLTNQILDFRLIELGKVKVNIQDEDVVSICQNIAQHFEFQIKEKEINYIFSSPFKSFKLLIDSEKLEKVLYNIISNALKYSPEKGQVIFSIEQKELNETTYAKTQFTGNKFLGSSLEIKVKDNGRGISEKNLPIIFDRFFVDKESDETGTGIGLHICQEYIRLHNGNIMVTSEQGNGTTFAINLPLDDNPKFEKENIIIQSHLDKDIDSDLEEIRKVNSENKRVLLFAEDNDELRVYLKNVLVNNFKVLTAKNGQQAYEIATEVLPDIIVSDIMMPGIDGIELTDRIKSNPKTNHIPIILLTALTDNKYQIDSMHKGADAFLTKPVDEKLLFARIENILNTRENLKKNFDDQGQKSTDSIANETFGQKAERIVENNLQNTLFDIESLSTKLGLSRSSLHRKIKAATNLSPSEFIRDVRLNNAVKLMKSGKYNIDEIGTFVGFNSTSYFIRSFKKKYGQTPKEYYSKLKN